MGRQCATLALGQFRLLELGHAAVSACVKSELEGKPRLLLSARRPPPVGFSLRDFKLSW
jgi:hypothetical protein